MALKYRFKKWLILDINRIESVTLLKDGAATAVYGSRAANGVMVITTKAPVAGKLQLSYNYELTFNGPDLSDYHVLNAKQKVDYEQLVGLYMIPRHLPAVIPNRMSLMHSCLPV
jgi:TonB-dependent SusC/RagA subfamily outer membrane receptor